MKELKVVCFDYYGTLVDVGRPFDKMKAWHADFLKRTQSAVTPHQFNLYFTKQRVKLLCQPTFRLGKEVLEVSYGTSCSHFGLAPDWEGFQALVRTLFTLPPAFEDAIYTVEQLKKRYPVCLITNADNDLLFSSIQKNGFCFDLVVSSEDARCNKPNKGIFNYLIERINVAPAQILVVGDSLQEDVYGALNSGMQAIHVNRDGADTRNGQEISALKQLLKMV